MDRSPRLNDERDRYAAVASILLAIEAELRRLDLWGDTAPDPRALASQEPFCIDTLRFDEWLQWIFLPRMRVIVEHGDALPACSGIHPLAEEWLARCAGDTRCLLDLILYFDELIENRVTPARYSVSRDTGH